MTRTLFAFDNSYKNLLNLELQINIFIKIFWKGVLCENPSVFPMSAYIHKKNLPVIVYLFKLIHLMNFDIFSPTYVHV